MAVSSSTIVLSGLTATATSSSGARRRTAAEGGCRFGITIPR